MDLMYQFVWIILTVLLIIVGYYKYSFRYWKIRNVPTLQEKIPFGSVEILFQNKFVCLGVQCKNIYDKIKAMGHSYVGYYRFTTPIIVPVDLDIIQHVLQRDFHYFTERGFYHNEKDDPLSANLFALGGERWRSIRTKLSPAFSPSKIKLMFDPLLQCAFQMEKFVNQHYESREPIDAKEVMACFTTDVIGSCAFGLECNSFTHPNAEFRLRGEKIFSFESFGRLVKAVISINWPDFALRLRMCLLDKETTDFFISVVKNTIKFRQEKKIVRKDILQLLMNQENELNVEDEALLKKLTAQVFIFFAAGFETSSTTLCFCLYELASNLDIQEKLRKEILQVLAKHRGKITYDSLMEMKYMNQVIDETLRKYPPVSFITRECVKDYTIPGTNTVIEKGIQLLVSILGLHRDPEYYPEPDKFDPERFSEENKSRIRPFAYIPFGEGPRICIGLPFGLLQVKAGLAVLLKGSRFTPNKKTEIPLDFKVLSFTLAPKSEVYLDVERVDRSG